MKHLKGNIVVNDGVLYADGVFFLSRETIQSDDASIQDSLTDLYDIVSYN